MKKQKTPNSPTFIEKSARVAAICIFILILLSVTRGVYTLTNSGSRINDAKIRFEEVKKDQEKLKLELEKVQSSFYQEKQVRDKLGLAKEGEIVVVLPEESILRRLSPRRDEEQYLAPPDPNWKKWAKLFFEI